MSTNPPRYMTGREFLDEIGKLDPPHLDRALTGREALFAIVRGEIPVPGTDDEDATCSFCFGEPISAAMSGWSSNTYLICSDCLECNKVAGRRVYFFGPNAFDPLPHRDIKAPYEPVAPPMKIDWVNGWPCLANDYER